MAACHNPSVPRVCRMAACYIPSVPRVCHMAACHIPSVPMVCRMAACHFPRPKLELSTLLCRLVACNFPSYRKSTTAATLVSQIGVNNRKQIFLLMVLVSQSIISPYRVYLSVIRVTNYKNRIYSFFEISIRIYIFC